MHLNNRKWLEDCKKKYPKNFNKCSVLEIGSQDVNGTARDYFEDCDYVGIDIEQGKGVDIVMNARKTKFETKFDTLLFLSVFEHDLNWKNTFKHNIQWIKKGGLCLVSFGSEGNLPHMDIWKPVPSQEFLSYCKELKVKVAEAFFEEDRYGNGDKGIFNLICEF